MNWSEIETGWTELAPLCQSQCPKLSKAQVEAIAGKRDHLSRVLQEVYGFSNEEVERSIAAFEKDCRKPGAVK